MAAPSSPFQSLAPELRNEIYRLALTDDEPVTISSSNGLAKPALLRVCKQITAEASKLYYANNTFKICVAPTTYKIIIKWLRSLGREHYSLISKVVLVADQAEARKLGRPSTNNATAVMLPPIQGQSIKRMWMALANAMLGTGMPAENISVGSDPVRPAIRVRHDFEVDFERSMRKQLELARAARNL